ncbi:DUF3551 domain-containing protein [Bradyrhizobium genosp. P]|uniref:DUF3551 domain-containing protein n=1 Tax=Bradyrhizobium genosp. P TaxID=83641 RepID=UPI003CE97EF8
MKKLIACMALATAVLAASVSASSAQSAQYIHARALDLNSRYCLQGRIWGYPGNCDFATYAQCAASASGTDAYCGINPQFAFARRGYYR